MHVFRHSRCFISDDIVSVFPVTEEEFLTLAEDLQPYTEEAMKIEVAPWIKEYVTDVDDLYSELTLEKLENKPFEYQRQTLDTYKELFTDQGPSEKRRKASSKKKLFKGEPGMGKTTLVKKVAWDWAKGIFTAVCIVFFVFLKLVNPGDAIENVIIDQTPVLEGLDVTGAKIAKILKQFGSRCLLILDGLDEHAQGQNEDVIRIMKGQKYLFCNVVVTSRPHSTRDIQKYFQTVVSVEGFTYSEAEKFACRILSDRHKIDQVLRFNPGRGRDRSPVYNVPILLSFICLLVREDDIDLSKDTTDIGEIYTRMVRCLYRKFTVRKGIEYKVSDFVDLLKSLGKLALETLLSENPLLKRKEVIAEVGEEAFDYGLLIGHEDAFRFIPDEAADIFVSFPHRTILEFLGSLCFIWRLNEGESIEDILGADNETPIFLTNPLFLQFCLWFLQKSDEMFSFLRKQELYKSLVVYAAQKVDHKVLFLRVITNRFSALDNFPVELFGNLGGGGQNEALLSFFGDILSECRSPQHLVFDLGFPIDWVLSSVKSNLKSLKSIEIERIPSGDFRFIPKAVFSCCLQEISLCENSSSEHKPD